MLRMMSRSSFLSKGKAISTRPGIVGYDRRGKDSESRDQAAVRIPSFHAGMFSGVMTNVMVQSLGCGIFRF